MTCNVKQWYGMLNNVVEKKPFIGEVDLVRTHGHDCLADHFHHIGLKCSPNCYRKQLRFVLGTTGFPLCCLPSLFDFGTIRPLQLQSPLSKLFLLNCL
jgi:hypothetical protein